VPALLLWDVDGTLIQTGGAGSAAMAIALERAHGCAPELAHVDLAGRTDHWIARRLLEAHDITSTPEAVAAFFDAYVEALPDALASHEGEVLPGIAELLSAFTARPDVVQGLLTGNTTRAARLKLEHYGLWQYFTFGVFGDDTELRAELGPLALADARYRHGAEFLPEHAIVIGDTPHDIDCGKALGARTVAVATGRYRLEELAAYEPTALFADLADTCAVLDLV
jgi:phosphoglycolate phosphatase